MEPGRAYPRVADSWVAGIQQWSITSSDLLHGSELRQNFPGDERLGVGEGGLLSKMVWMRGMQGLLWKKETC